MIHSLEDLLVVSDIDNTLLQADIGIPSCNVAMIRLFCALGGRFTVASGRSTASVERYINQLPLNAPAIVYGGAVLHDFSQNRTVARSFIDRHSARRAVEDVLAQFPHVGVEIMADNERIYVVNSGDQVCAHTVEEQLDYVVAQMDDVPGSWYKVLFADSPAALAPVREFLEQRSYENITFLQTNAMYYEIMPQGVDKGTALKRLSEETGIPVEHIFAIGDYYNDLELLKAAGHPIAIGNAVPEVKMLCEETVLGCMDGGVAQFLYELIKKYSK